MGPLPPISPNTSHFLEAVFSMVRKIYGRQPGDPMTYLIVNLAIWWMFRNAILRAAVHLGNDCDMNLKVVKNYLWKTLRMAKRCSSGCRDEETLRDRRRQGTCEFPWRFKKYEETRRFRKLRHLRQWQKLATQSPFINKLCATHGECLSIVRQRFGLSPTDQMKPRCERSHMGYISACHSSCCSSSWYRLHGELGMA